MKLEDAFCRLKRKLKINFDLKTCQKETIQSLLCFNDTFAILPTGYGKSFIFSIFPLLKDELEGVSFDFSPFHSQ
jgi:superfamily II DNA helicase RecQ